MAPRTREELISLAAMDANLAAALEEGLPTRPPKPSDPYYGRTDYTALREHRATVLKEKWPLRYLPGRIAEVTEEDQKIPVRDGSEITIRVYKPAVEKKGGSPLIVMFHEGGWGMGDLSDEEVNCRLFSRELGAVCVNVEYRLAPEYPFPTWINDAWDALQWCGRHASELGADPSRGFVVGGGSAGGNIAAVLAHIARDEQLSPPLTGQYLCVPAIMCFLPPSHIPAQYRSEYISHPLVTPSTDPILNVSLGSSNPVITPIIKSILGLLPIKLLSSVFGMAGIHGDMSSPLFVPFHYGRLEGGHKSLPPAYFQVCGLDPLRDEGLIYERVLREEAGVETRINIYKGLGHYFWTNFPELEDSKTFVEDTVRGMRWLLENTAR
ncbi:putative Alpha/beta hydrolase fold-3 domain-containing protein [Seiridium cardinale]